MAVGMLMAAVVCTALSSVRIVEVEGKSMTPALQPKDRLLVRRVFGRRLKAGQVVVLRPPRRRPGQPAFYVKRVAAVEGDRVTFDAPGTRIGDLVPARSLLVLGDNIHSLDSRLWGLLPTRLVVGVMVRKLTT